MTTPAPEVYTDGHLLPLHDALPIYAVALVDEFQAPDARQWRIFDRVFGVASGAPALYVIGDPKQAIYGFRGGDVETYLAARATAAEAPPLSSNFRSRPSVLRAVSALYAQANAAAAADNATEPHRQITAPHGRRAGWDRVGQDG